MKKIFNLIILSGLFLFMGCGTTHYIDRTDTIIKHDTIKVAVPFISDTLQALNDSLNQVIYGFKMQGKDTVLDIRYYPKDHKIYVKVKPDTIKVPWADTVSISHTTQITKEPGWFEKNGWWIIIIIVGLIVLIILLKK